MAVERNITGREMLRDFWDHWVWETRIGEFEASTPPRTPNPELREQIAHYQHKYGEQALSGTHRLAAIMEQGTPSRALADAEVEAGLALLLRRKHGDTLARLEALSPLMDEVLPAEPAQKPPSWAPVPTATTCVGEGYDLRAVADFFAALAKVLRRRPEYESHAATLTALQPALREALKCLESPKILVDSYAPELIAALVRNLGAQ